MIFDDFACILSKWSIQVFEQSDFQPSFCHHPFSFLTNRSYQKEKNQKFYFLGKNANFAIFTENRQLHNLPTLWPIYKKSRHPMTFILIGINCYTAVQYIQLMAVVTESHNLSRKSSKIPILHQNAVLCIFSLLCLDFRPEY